MKAKLEMEYKRINELVVRRREPSNKSQATRKIREERLERKRSRKRVSELLETPLSHWARKARCGRTACSA